MSRILSGQLTAGLSGLRPRLAQCPDSFMQGGFGGGAALGVGNDGYKLLMLDVRTLDQKVEILDVSAALGSASAAFEACAREVLRNQIIPVRAAGAGERTRIAVELFPDEADDPQSREQLLERIREMDGALSPAVR